MFLRLGSRNEGRFKQAYLHDISIRRTISTEKEVGAFKATEPVGYVGMLKPILETSS